MLLPSLLLVYLNFAYTHICILDNPYGPNAKDFAALAINPLLAQFARLSASCPVLNEIVPELDLLGGSLGSSPRHQPPSRKGSGMYLYIASLIQLKNVFNVKKIHEKQYRRFYVF